MTKSDTPKGPHWIQAAEAAAAERIASTRMPPDGVAVMLSREQVAQLIRDTAVWAYGRGRAEGQYFSMSSH